MKLSRLISTEAWKGTPGYLNSQRKYEIAKTVILFGVSLSLFFAGFFTTNTRLNLLTIVAVLGCLPASKSLVGAIMFCRYRSLPVELKELFGPREGDLMILHDMIFTGYDKNFPVEHIAIKGNTICGYSTQKNFDEQAFHAHIMPLLKKDTCCLVAIRTRSRNACIRVNGSAK